MPRDNLNSYYVPGGYSQRTITCMSRMVYTCSANSTAMYARLYATANSLIQRVNGQGDVRGTAWYSLATRGLVLGGGVGGGVGRMVHCNSYSDD